MGMQGHLLAWLVNLQKDGEGRVGWAGIAAPIRIRGRRQQSQAAVIVLTEAEPMQVLGSHQARQHAGAKAWASILPG